ncbi:MAG: radical SAM protein [Candidatus Bathyarchaeota archaeon]|nr:radical SAM protein [Candidatus Bathyarchaeota archaeon]
MKQATLTYTQYKSPQKKSYAEIIQEHPCYDSKAHFKFGRVHLPVAAGCNIGCNYCVRKYDCANENRPGVTSKLLDAKEAIEKVRCTVKHDPRLRVVGISGPGDPLTSDTTFEVFEQVHNEFPDLTLCLSTNGLLLPQKLSQIKKVGVNALTITINAVDPDVGSKIYSFVNYQGKTLHDKEAFQVLSKNQLDGLREAAAADIAVKVNTVYIPTINAEHIPEIAKTVRSLKAYIMNIIPLIPQGKFAHIPAPTQQDIHTIRQACQDTLIQFHNCVQCRADATGVPGEEACGSRLPNFEQHLKTKETP